MSSFNRARLSLMTATQLAATVVVAGFTESSLAQQLPLNVTHVNDFNAGYDRNAHAYRESWIRDVVTDPKTRPINADVCSAMITKRIRQTSIIDGQHCGDRVVLVPPTGVSSLTWTLRGKNPLTGTTRDLIRIQKSLKRLQPHTPGSTCLPVTDGPLPLVVNKSDCNVVLTAPVPQNAITPNASVSYDVQVQAVGSNGPLATASKPIVVPSKVPLVVSVGESLASGEGNPDKAGKSKRDGNNIIGNPNGKDCFDDTTMMMKNDNKPGMRSLPVWFDARDHRSLKSAPALAARQLLVDWPYVVFLSFAKSGSRISSPDQPHNILRQLEQVRATVGTHRIDVLLVSAGGNDVGFAGTLEGLTTGDLSSSDAISKFSSKLIDLREDFYPAINKRITELGLNVANVLINEYPGSIFNVADNKPARGCGVFRVEGILGGIVGSRYSITESEAKNIDSMGRLLNAEVKQAAQTHGWRFVDGIDEKFAGRGYCSGRSLYVFADKSCDLQGDFDGTMHPNAAGTLLIANAIASEIRKAIPKPGTVLATGN